MATQSSNLSTHFKIQSFDVLKVLREFKENIHTNKFFDNADFLWRNSSLVRFSKGVWKYRPEIFCLDYYNDPYFFPVILTVNNLGSVFEFLPSNLTKELIIAPQKADIIKLVSV